MCLDPECWVEEKILYHLTPQLPTARQLQQALQETKDRGEELKREVVGTHLLQQVAEKLHGVQLDQLVQIAGGPTAQLKHEGE